MSSLDVRGVSFLRPEGLSLDPSTARRAQNASSPVTNEQAARVDADQVVLSNGTSRIQQAEPGVRTELVARIRKEIQSGQYDTPDRLDRAIDALADDLL